MTLWSEWLAQTVISEAVMTNCDSKLLRRCSPCQSEPVMLWRHFGFLFIRPYPTRLRQWAWTISRWMNHRVATLRSCNGWYMFYSPSLVTLDWFRSENHWVPTLRLWQCCFTVFIRQFCRTNSPWICQKSNMVTLFFLAFDMLWETHHICHRGSYYAKLAFTISSSFLLLHFFHIRYRLCISFFRVLAPLFIRVELISVYS